MVTIEIIVWIFGTFDYNLEMKNAFISYLKESCLLFSVAHFSFYLIVCYNMESITKVYFTWMWSYLGVGLNKLFVSCNLTLTSFFIEKYPFSAHPTAMNVSCIKHA